MYGKSVKDHDENLHKTLQIIKESGLKLNKNKCEFRKSTPNYFGHVLSADGVSPDPGKVKAIIIIIIIIIIQRLQQKY